MSTSWLPIPANSGYDVDCLPYAVDDDGVLVAVGESVLDLSGCARALRSPHAEVLSAPSLDGLLRAGPSVWTAVRSEIRDWLTDGARRHEIEPFLRPRDNSRLRLPFTVGDYVDFYASEHHAANLGRLLRPGQPSLLPNWRHLPVGYHGRSGTVVVSGKDVVRPCGQLPPAAAGGGPRFGPTEKLDVEVEVGFVVGTGTARGSSLATADFASSVFGICLVNDWSARDIQAWEYQPLGPFLGKSFATSISAWVTPLAALADARVAPPSSGTALTDYLVEQEPWGLDLSLELRVNDVVLSHPPYAAMHWSPAQMLAHMTVNGASVRPGDLFASGTVSGPDRSQWGSLMELGDNSRFLADGDEVVITGLARGIGGAPICLGEVRGRVVAAVPF